MIQKTHFYLQLLKNYTQQKNKKTKKIKFWGTGKAKREFTCVDEISELVYFLNKKTNHTNIW